MIDAPHVTQIAAQHTAVIRLTIPRAEIQAVMGPGISDIEGLFRIQPSHFTEHKTRVLHAIGAQ